MIGTMTDKGNVLKLADDIRLQVRHPDISNAPNEEREERQYWLWRFITEFDHYTRQ